MDRLRLIDTVRSGIIKRQRKGVKFFEAFVNPIGKCGLDDSIIKECKTQKEAKEFILKTRKQLEENGNKAI